MFGKEQVGRCCTVQLTLPKTSLVAKIVINLLSFRPCDNSVCWNPSPFMQMKKSGLGEVSGKTNSYHLLSTKYRPCILCAYGISFH